MICFLPPLPAMRPEPEPIPPRTARAAEAVILIFVVLNVLFVLTGLLPLLVKMEERRNSTPENGACVPAGAHACRPSAPVGMRFHEEKR